MTVHLVHVMQQLVSYFSDLILDRRQAITQIPARRMEHTLKSTRRIQVGITR